MTPAPQFLVLGHIVKDVVAGGWRPGGGVLYAAAQAAALGCRVAALTRCSKDVRPEQVLPGVEWHVLPADVTTSFENRYADGRRQQRLDAIAPPINFEDVPAAWRNTPVALLAPVFHDVHPGAAAELLQTVELIGIGAQGWLRQLQDGVVQPGQFEPDVAWLSGHALFVSDEDLVDYERVGEWQSIVPQVVLTRAGRGCSLWDTAGRTDLDGFATDEVDPTGAGDVFSAAFLVRLHETGDARDAARFASAAAALSVRAEGIGGIAGRTAVEDLMRRQAVRA